MNRSILIYFVLLSSSGSVSLNQLNHLQNVTPYTLIINCTESIPQVSLYKNSDSVIELYEFSYEMKYNLQYKCYNLRIPNISFAKSDDPHLCDKNYDSNEQTNYKSFLVDLSFSDERKYNKLELAIDLCSNSLEILCQNDYSTINEHKIINSSLLNDTDISKHKFRDSLYGKKHSKVHRNVHTKFSIIFESSKCKEKSLSIEKGSLTIQKDIILYAEFSPFIKKIIEINDNDYILTCKSDGSPKPHVQWYTSINGSQQLLDIDNESTNLSFSHTVTTDGTYGMCNAVTQLRIRNTYGIHPVINYSCVALNKFGQSIEYFTFEDFYSTLFESRKIKPFNMTGFIIGMIPPLLISFYIIIKLGYRSRYAQERPDDEGIHEEPLF